MARDVAGPLAARTDREARWPEEPLLALLDAGLGGLLLPADFSGLGLGASALGQVCEVLGEQCASTSLCFGMHLVATSVLASKATSEQAARLLTPCAEGEGLVGLALSERGTGARFWSPRSTLTRASGGYRLRGTKHFVTNGGHARWYVVSARHAEATTEDLYSMVVVPASAGGVEFEGAWTGLGMRGNSSIAMNLDDVHVPDQDLLGATGDQLWYVFQVVAPLFLTAMAATSLGIAQRAFLEARSHVQARTYDGPGPDLARAETAQARIANVWSRIQRTRSLLRWAADEFEAAGSQSLEAMFMSKVEAARCAVRTTDDAIRLCGGVGYSHDGVLGRLLRDARAANIMAPTTEFLEVFAGRTLLDLPVLDELEGDRGGGQA